jgi:formylglycine-generating enzyme required for sulfatase activity
MKRRIGLVLGLPILAIIGIVAVSHLQGVSYFKRGQAGAAAAEPSPPVDKGIFTSSAIGAKFTLIPPGTFTMGSTSDEPGHDPEESPQHQVTISRPFYLQTTEVTQGQWKRIMGDNPSHFENCGDNCPVEYVSWNDVHEFIRKLNRQEKTDKYRLPTEAEWEYSARAGTQGTRYGDVDNIAWYSMNSGSHTHAVGTKLPNAWGLYDMMGNVWEWVQDWKGDYAPGHVTDPTGPSSGSIRVNRGGCWYFDSFACRAAIRGGFTPIGKSSFVGFRLVRTQ